MDKIMIIGVGGAGCNMAETFKREAKLEKLKAAQYVFIGAYGHSCSHKKDDGRLLCDSSVCQDITYHFFDGVDRVYILAGMGHSIV